jgi:hypothetical protein
MIIAMLKSRFKYLLVILTMLAFPRVTAGQQLGMSFSFFFPRNGSFSNPISPFSIRGVGINPSPYFSLESGFTLYRMSGMNVTGLPFQSDQPMMGPFFSMFVPVQAVFKLPMKKFTFSIKGGGFLFYNFDNHIIYGNIDRAIRDYKGWDVANSDLKFDNEIGYGFIVGAELIVYFTKKFGMNFEVNYLNGGAPVNFRGKYTGGNSSTGFLTEIAEYPGSKLDFTGMEITIGILFNTK